MLIVRGAAVGSAEISVAVVAVLIAALHGLIWILTVVVSYLFRHTDSVQLSDRTGFSWVSGYYARPGRGHCARLCFASKIPCLAW